MLLRYHGGARGILHASQISCGEENNLNIRVYGTKGSLAWQQEHPNELKFIPKGEPARILRRGNDYVSDAQKNSRGCPSAIPRRSSRRSRTFISKPPPRSARTSKASAAATHDFPTIDDGIIRHGVHRNRREIRPLQREVDALCKSLGDAVKSTPSRKATNGNASPVLRVAVAVPTYRLGNTALLFYRAKVIFETFSFQRCLSKD
jgi:hypothetical protein